MATRLRAGAVDRGNADACLVLVDLEPAQILFRRGVGRATEERGTASDWTDVVLLRMRPKATHHHVVLHALAQRADRRDGG